MRHKMCFIFQISSAGLQARLNEDTLHLVSGDSSLLAHSIVAMRASLGSVPV
jgi:hypothetical protein